ncbi:MAG: hypothetical protein GY778_17665 [bacterium]|nr:hypothetical protein [bacterium]
MPDECEVPPDCNSNGIGDACDVADETSQDFNTNGIPDECEVFPDCNSNGIPDHIDFSAIEWAKLTASDAEDFDYFGDSVAISGDVAVIGVPKDDTVAIDAGSAYVFRFDGSTWVEEAHLAASDGTEADEFGGAVTVSGDLVLIGAEGDFAGSSGTGSAYVFRYDGSSWVEEVKLTADDPGTGLSWSFGHSVSVSGNVAVVGTIGGSGVGTAGSAYVYRYDGSAWVKEARLAPSDGEYYYHFGRSVSVSGDVIAVGAPGHLDFKWNIHGAAYVYRHNGTSWVEEAKIAGVTDWPGAYLGSAVAVDGDVLVIGAPAGEFNYEPYPGMAVVFRYDGGVWVEEAKFFAGFAQTTDYFGCSISLSGDVALIGARQDVNAGVTTGAAYMYRYVDGAWWAQAKLVASDGAELDRFGGSVAISGGVAVIGASVGSDGGTSSESAYVFAVQSTDCDANGVPDDCEALPDCNSNGVVDPCDVAAGSSLDCDANGVPDDCVPAQPDCNSNGVGDGCDVADGTSLDCDGGGAPDECEGLPDCDSNGIPDDCEVIGRRLAKLAAFDPQLDDWFGSSLAVSGAAVLIGAPHDIYAADETGSVYAYRLQNNGWVMEGELIPPGAAPRDYIGYSVSMSGDVAVIGAPGDDDRCPSQTNCGTGSVYLYRYNGYTWMAQAELTASDAAAGDSFGRAVSIDGDLLVVGASNSAYVFRHNSSYWEEEAKLTASDAALGDRFGDAVSVSGDVVVIGAKDDDGTGTSSGSAYVYRYDGNAWVEEAKLTASDGAAEDYFGASVSISGDVALIGAYGHNHPGVETGSVYVYRYDGSAWTEETELTASDAGTSDLFGHSVAVNGDWAVIGGRGPDWSPWDSRSAYLFRYDIGSWVKQAKLSVPDATVWNGSSVAVAISDHLAVIGVPREAEWRVEPGSAYVFAIGNDDCNANGIFDQCESGHGDDDCDGDADVDDFVAWPACMTGPDNGPYAAGCEVFDFDADDDVDVRDFAGFQGGVLPPPPGDYDGDGDVDLDDLADWPACVTGPDQGPYPAGCDPYDLDPDLDVDLADFAEFQTVYTGSLP